MPERTPLIAGNWKMFKTVAEATATAGRLAELVAGITGFRGKIEYDPSMPDGTPRKLLDVGRLKSLGWEAGIA